MNVTEDRLARAALTRLFEPNDRTGRALVGHHGAPVALSIATGATPALPFIGVTAEELADGLKRWASRIPDLRPEHDLANIQRLGGGFLTPDDEQWPAALNDLADAPLGLWYRGHIEPGIPDIDLSVALTGSRASTSYGASVAGDMAYTAGYEHTSASVDGRQRTYPLRVTQVYRREDGEWRVAHRHADTVEE